MTYSIVARDEKTGFLGVAVASRFFAVGGVVPHVRGRLGAIATQGFVNPRYGTEGLLLLAQGEVPRAIALPLMAPIRCPSMPPETRGS